MTRGKPLRARVYGLFRRYSELYSEECCLDHREVARWAKRYRNELLLISMMHEHSRVLAARRKLARKREKNLEAVQAWRVERERLEARSATPSKEPKLKPEAMRRLRQELLFNGDEELDRAVRAAKLANMDAARSQTPPLNERGPHKPGTITVDQTELGGRKREYSNIERKLMRRDGLIEKKPKPKLKSERRALALRSDFPTPMILGRRRER